jgi:hypothetical protein
MKKQFILPFLPGYMFDGDRLVSTGTAISPTQHINPANGEIVYYVRPIFKHDGAFVGMYIRHVGIINYINSLESSGLD